MHSFSQHHLAAQRNWETALKTYRNALLAYRRLLEMQESNSKRGRPISRRSVASSPQAVRRAPRLEGLTPRECEVAALVARGYTNQQIANALVLTAGTVANHVAHVLYKLGATNRTQVAARVLESAASSHDGSATDGAVSAPRAALAVVPRRGPPSAQSRAVAEDVRAPVVQLRG